MPIEKRTRIEIFLPARSDLSSYRIVLEWLAEEFAFTRGGSTLTTPFIGLFVSSTRIDIVQDAIRILYCDFELNCENEEDLREILDYLEPAKNFLMETLEEEEVWVNFLPDYACCFLSFTNGEIYDTD